jgi:hypothetical protein
MAYSVWPCFLVCVLFYSLNGFLLSFSFFILNYFFFLNIKEEEIKVQSIVQTLLYIVEIYINFIFLKLKAFLLIL